MLLWWRHDTESSHTVEVCRCLSSRREALGDCPHDNSAAQRRITSKQGADVWTLSFSWIKPCLNQPMKDCFTSPTFVCASVWHDWSSGRADSWGTGLGSELFLPIHCPAGAVVSLDRLRSA